MGKQTKSSESSSKRRRRPAMSPEAREQQLISLAYDVAERQLLEGTISASALTQLLKAGSERTRMDLEKIRNENELLKAKKHAIENEEDMKTLFENAITAMRTYQGLVVEESEDL